jgi:hypothetical protein
MSPPFPGGSSVGPVTKRTKIFLWKIYRWSVVFFRESLLVISGLSVDECHMFSNTLSYHGLKNACSSREQTAMHGFSVVNSSKV